MKPCSYSRLGFTVTILLTSSAIQPVHAQMEQSQREVPTAIKAVMQKAAYANATWGLRVIDLETGKDLINLEPDKAGVAPPRYGMWR